MRSTADPLQHDAGICMQWQNRTASQPAVCLAFLLFIQTLFSSRSTCSALIPAVQEALSFLELCCLLCVRLWFCDGPLLRSSFPSPLSRQQVLRCLPHVDCPQWPTRPPRPSVLLFGACPIRLRVPRLTTLLHWIPSPHRSRT